MSFEELSIESKWHFQKASKLFEQVSEMRELALIVDPHERGEILRAAMETEAEADEHSYQAHLCDSLRAAKLSERGVGVVVSLARA